jgi:DNA-binding NarL/FixJ family response regulator
MGGVSRIVVIGAPALRDQLANMLPETDVHLAANPLEGIWSSVQAGCHGVCVEFSPGLQRDPILRALRQALPHARLIVLCTAANEPLARTALDQGADDYLLMPLDAGEVQCALGAASA